MDKLTSNRANSSIDTSTHCASQQEVAGSTIAHTHILSLSLSRPYLAVDRVGGDGGWGERESCVTLVTNDVTADGRPFG